MSATATILMSRRLFGATLLTAPALTASRPRLQPGSTGAAVTALQRRLAALHYDVGPVDGRFGASTLHGVYAFQKVQGLGIDGVVGPATYAALDAPHVPRPRHTLDAAAVEIDLGLRVLLLTRAGRVTRVVDASPGKPSTPTVTGAFEVTRRIDGWRRSALGLLWRPNYFHAGYAVHGAPSVPTYAASHGCVRVTVPAMDRLWPVLRVGEKVWVHH